MKAIAATFVLLFGFSDAVRLDSTGVWVNDSCVQGPAMQLRETSTGPLLASASAVEPLATPLSVAIPPDRTLVLEPGVRLEKTAEGYLLSTHGDQKIHITGEAREIELQSPVVLCLTQVGWEVGSTTFAAKDLLIRALPPAAKRRRPPFNAHFVGPGRENPILRKETGGLRSLNSVSPSGLSD